MGANLAACASWPLAGFDLASTRHAAGEFLENLAIADACKASGRQDWATKWTRIGDDQCLRSDEKFEKGAYEDAAEAWFCALTAFEVARRLTDEDDTQGEEFAAKVEAGIERFGVSWHSKVERTQVSRWDESELPAYYLRAGAPDVRAPAVICISREGNAGASLLGRLLPVAISRGISLLVVSHDDLSGTWRGQSEALLSCCLDYLSLRPDVDHHRIGVYGEGLSAALATDFAMSNRGVAAAVCDGGLWKWTRTKASVGWMTGAEDLTDETIVSARRSRLVRQLKCPVLVIAGGCGAVSVSEAVKLQADCMGSNVDLEVVMPRIARCSEGEIENFVASDHCIFGWLQDKLAQSAAHKNGENPGRS